MARCPMASSNIPNAAAFMLHMARACRAKARGSLAEARAHLLAPTYMGLGKTDEERQEHLREWIFRCIVEAKSYREAAAGYARTAERERQSGVHRPWWAGEVDMASC